MIETCKLKEKKRIMQTSMNDNDDKKRENAKKQKTK